MSKTSRDIRAEFIRFFEERGHRFVPSSPLLPAEDPTLLFANAGMNQFKDIFLGRESRDYVRATNSQKCIRAGGKHNDLEDVGHDTYHHTFFEMLGNWSFGDYFKEDAIRWAWELLTNVWGLPKDRLYATVFEGDAAADLPHDAEAETLWKQVTDIDPSHVLRAGTADNFWEMGATGPCGVTSEIHIDLTPGGSGGPLVNAAHPDVIELWNLVFIQYNRDAEGTLTPLPAKHVDTGLGLERMCRVLQGKASNYATDLFRPLLEQVETFTDHRYGAAAGLADRFDVGTEDDMGDVACRVVADHARALTCAIADGVLPSNEGRGYVLRRILRRAARYARQYLDIRRPFLHELVPAVVDLLGEAYPGLAERQHRAAETIREEEESFGRTLDRGLELFEKQADRLREAGQTTLDGEVAFDLYATYGFPVDLTQLMARERGLTVDMAGYEEAMEEHRATSAAGGGAFRAADLPDLPATDDSAKYHAEPVQATVQGWVAGGAFVTAGALDAGTEAAVVLDRTNFYGEQGGQVGDGGTLLGPAGVFEVDEAKWAGPAVLHVGRVRSGRIAAGQTVRAEVCARRADIMRNHTATHLLNAALRRVLGQHVDQAGSVVAADRLRFDFSHGQALTDKQLARVEREVNDLVQADLPVTATTMPLAEARKLPGVRAVFGEKYPDPVRVIRVGPGEGAGPEAAPVSAEFCGGTHLDRTGRIGLFKILSEESVAKGVRRITAATGPAAVARVQEMDAALCQISAALKAPPEQAPQRIAALQKELKELRKGGGGGAGGPAELEVVQTVASPEGDVVIGKTASADPAAMRSLCDRQRQKGAAAVFVGAVGDGKVMLVAMVSDALVASSGIKAGDWVKAVAPTVGGGGGGKPTLAQAGGKQPEKLDEALTAAAAWVGQKL